MEVHLYLETFVVYEGFNYREPFSKVSLIFKLIFSCYITFEIIMTRKSNFATHTFLACHKM